MQFVVGEVYEIPLQEGGSVHGKAISVNEDELGTYVRYDIQEYGGVLKDGSPDPDHRYITQEYYYPKVMDTSGLENGTGMPLEYAGKLYYDDFFWTYYPKDTSVQKALVEEYISKFDQYLAEGIGLFLTSKTKGSGKTLLACCIGDEIIRRYRLQVKFINITDYIQAVRNGEAEPYREASVLILDDIGSQDEKHEWIIELVYGLVNYRYSNRKTTIYTSNLELEKCSDDDRITSRIYEKSIELHIPEVSVRKMIADQRKKDFRASLR